MIEFLVDSISHAGLVLGRNGDRDIAVGTTFTAVRQSRVHKEAGGYRSEDLGTVGRIALTLRDVHWYQRTIDRVPRGHTAGLVVTGDGLGLLSCLLRDLPPHENLSLIAEECKDTELNAESDPAARRDARGTR